MSLQTLATDRLRTAIARKGSTLAIELVGTADLDAREDFLAWIHQLHQEMLAAQGKRVEVNLHQLEFMSSMCVNVLVGWLVSIMELPLENQYEVQLLWDKSQLWQRRSVHALRRFAPRIVRSKP
jgi:hypothetical protein